MFPFHPWRPGLYLLPLWAGRDRKRDGGMRENEAGGVAWNDLGMRAKEEERQRKSGRIKSQLIKNKFFPSPGSESDNTDI